ncbi:MAG: glycosyltransferase family A protein [Saccharolobus sp.]|jgi:glycosyltransferase involved in cell wall biosynthesis|uniref:glycosyltransferase n=1 Tax=Saccharolobus sp. TaxID=2100761 RepID=UPI0028CF88B2|nr:glycosyltransferase family A protein [Saccharolobus sp.]MDT7862451.1 glycosyltransferase family A protein [Saccharolobus sp.]
MKICIYGTVFNSVKKVENSIKSVFKPDYDIVIVDSYSSDGTWEELQKLRKEYNLILLRFKSSRGKGRDYALKYCPDNSITAYFDLDAVYNENFHKLLELNLNFTHAGAIQWTYIADKSYIIRMGGWKDLNSAEDVELESRLKIDNFFPLIIGYNERVIGGRESRYTKSKLSIYKRYTRYLIDNIRGNGFTLSDLINLYKKEGKKKWIYRIFLFPIAKFKGIYRNCGNINNTTCTILKDIEAMKEPKDFGFSDDYTIFVLPKDMAPEKYILKIDFKIIKEYHNLLLYAKNEMSLKNFIEYVR